jgi:hypothetical protein
MQNLTFENMQQTDEPKPCMASTAELTAFLRAIASAY